MILFICLRWHVFGWPYVVVDLGSIRHFFHGAISEVYDGNDVSSLLPEKYVIWFKVAMDDLFVFDSLVSLKDLTEYRHSLLVWHSFRMLFDTIS